MNLGFPIQVLVKTIWCHNYIYKLYMYIIYIQQQIILQLVRTVYFLFCIPSHHLKYLFCRQWAFVWATDLNVDIHRHPPMISFSKQKINPVKRSTGGFHWPRVGMQYLIKTTLYCTITIQTSCFAGVVSIDSGLELIYQFVSCLRVKEQRNRRLEERKGEISLIGSAAVLLNTEIEGSMCLFLHTLIFLAFISLSPGQT